MKRQQQSCYLHSVQRLAAVSRPAGGGRSALALLVLATLSASAAADVAVLNITDEVALRTAGSLPDATNVGGVGVAGRLCVVNTQAGKGVRLTFSSANGVAGDGKAWLAKNLSTGATTPYRQSISLADGTAKRLVSGTASTVVDIPASGVVGSVALCPPGGTLIKWVTVTGVPSQGIFSDAVSIVATSL